MKRMFLMTILAATGSMVLAQQAPGAGASVAGGAPAIAPVPPTTVSSATNAVGSRPDLAKVQAIFAELSSLSKDLRPQEEQIQANDPDLKALVEKREAAMQVVKDLETKRRDLIDAKLSADPKLAPLVAKRRELQQTLKDMRPPAASGGPAGANRTGYGPRRMPSPEGAEPMRTAPMPQVSAPAPAPAAEKPVENPVPQAK